MKEVLCKLVWNPSSIVKNFNLDLSTLKIIFNMSICLKEYGRGFTFTIDLGKKAIENKTI